GRRRRSSGTCRRRTGSRLRPSSAELRERRAAALEEGPHPELFRDLLCLVDVARGAGTITTPLGDESGDVARPRLPAALAVTLGELESAGRSEEHTSELQSPDHLVCRLLLEKKKTDEPQPHLHTT